MRRDVIIGIDAGTSVIKSVAFQTDGTQLGVFALPNVYKIIEGGGAEQDMTRTWNDTAATLRGLADIVPSLASRTIALAVTAQGDGTWLIDDDGQPTAPAMLWLDARASKVVEGLRGSVRERRVFERTGTGLNACLQSAQLLWLKQNKPELIQRSATAFHCKDWLYYKFTGFRAGDPSETLFTYGNLRTRKLDSVVLAELGLEAEARLIPPIVDGLRDIGRLTEAAEQATGLPAGLPVVLGYVDIVTTALGAGAFDREAQAGCTIIGSTGIHMRYVPSVDDLIPPLEPTGYTIAFPLGRSYVQLQSNMASTLNLDWMIDLGRDMLSFGDVVVSREAFIASIDRRALAARPGDLLYHPYISEAGERGPFVDAAARAQFLGLHEAHRYDDLLRAIIEGLAFAARDCYESIGGVPREIRVTGGASRSKAFTAILGAVLDTDIRTSARDETGAAGAAMIAAVALELYPDMETCTDTWVTPLLQSPLKPDANLSKRYKALFPIYVDARRASAPVWKSLENARRAAV